MKSSPAQNLFDVMSDGSVDVSSLGLLSQLVAAGLMTLRDPVKTDIGPKPFFSAMLSLVGPGKFAPGFYSPQAAMELLDLDPQFFNRPHEGGLLWLEHSLWGWARHEDRARMGFCISGHTTIDKWAKVAFESLSHENKANTALWKSALKLGLPSALGVLAAAHPDAWLRTDNKGRQPLLSSASGAWAWDQALEAGVDPYAPTAKGLPLWRAMLPQASTSEAVAGSFRAGVEAWVLNQLEERGDDFDLLEYMRRAALGRMSTNSGANAWLRLSHAEQVEYVSGLPDRWVNWSSDGVPVWLRMAGHRDTNAKDWVKTVVKHPEWITAIKEDALSHLAFEALKSHKGLPNKIPETLCLMAVLDDPRKNVVFDACSNLTKVPRGEWDAWLDSLSLQAQTRTAPPATRSPRF